MTISGKSPIGEEIDRFVSIISGVACLLGLIFFNLAIFIGYQFIDALVLFIGIMVANVPQGLPMTVTVILLALYSLRSILIFKWYWRLGLLNALSEENGAEEVLGEEAEDS
jgi:P-type E1-E2 ATPase